MTKKMILVLTMVVVAMVTACGAKETMKTIENTDDIIVVDNADETREVEATTEDVFGDVDVDMSTISMDMMNIQQVGLDLPFSIDEGLTCPDWIQNIEVLFMSPLYQTEQTNSKTISKMDDVDISVCVRVNSGNSLNTNGDDLTFGDVIFGRDEYNNVNTGGFRAQYYFYDTVNDLTMDIGVTAVFNENVRGDAVKEFGETYISELEETLLNSIQK